MSPVVLHNVGEEGVKDTPALVFARSEWVEKLLSMLHLEGVTWDGPGGLSQAQELFEEYQDIFVLEPGEIGCCDLAMHTTKLIKINLSRSITDPSTLAWRTKCEHILNMLATGAIASSKSPWSNAVILVYKKDCSLHYCIDFCWLNTDKGLSHCLGSKKLSNTWLDPLCFLLLTSTQDFGKSKWMRSWSNTLHCSIGNYGFCKFKWMPFGLCNAPTIFQ